MTSSALSQRPERHLLLGLSCLLGAYLFQVQSYLWGGETIPGRGTAWWVLSLVGLGVCLGWKRDLGRIHLLLQITMLSSLPWWHECLRNDQLSKGWLHGGAGLLLFSAGWMFASPLRALLHIDLRKEESLALGILLRDLAVLAAIFALLPYFGPLPVSVALGGAVWLWWLREAPATEKTCSWVALLSFIPSFSLGILCWSSGAFLSVAGTWPVEVQHLQGQHFYLERDHRVPLYRFSGPGGDILSADQHRLAEAAIAPWFEQLRGPARVLLVGGEDGVILRELLSSPKIERVDLWSARPARLQAFAKQPLLRKLHLDAFRDVRVQKHLYPNPNALWEAFKRPNPSRYAAIILATDPPTRPTMRRLYAPSFLRMLRRHLAPQGSLVVVAGAWEAADDIACLGYTLRRVGFRTIPYRASGMDITWTFWWATQRTLDLQKVRLPQGLRSLQQAMWPGMLSFPRVFDPRRAPQAACVDALSSLANQD
ncbi:MAG: hypothetical protein H6728_02460 [Myxococcales bacterium]|nr:hypothetical protein [Myxococcales bacterium]MCB9641917.1 hypothetical protein [Myxococcales bacterium]